MHWVIVGNGIVAVVWINGAQVWLMFGYGGESGGAFF
jgi:hypothetical protein